MHTIYSMIKKGKKNNRIVTVEVSAAIVGHLSSLSFATYGCLLLLSTGFTLLSFVERSRLPGVSVFFTHCDPI